MRQSRPEGPQRQKGFTLIELLIVIVVLGVLAAVVILAVGAFNNRGELAACQADVKSVESAVEAYRAKKGQYPESLDDLAGDYLRELPNTAEGSGEYWIRYDSTSGTVEGKLKNNTVCAGGLAMSTAEPTSTATSGPGGGGPGGGEPGGGSPSNSPSPSGGGSPSNSPSPSGGGSPSNSPSGGSSPSNSPTSPGGGNPSNPNPNPTPGQPGTPVANCFDPPGGIDDIDCVLSWSAPSGPVTGYEWQLANRDGSTCSAEDDFGQWDFPWTERVGTNSVTFEVLLPTNYCFRVRALNGNIRGPWSNPVGFRWAPDWT